MKIVHEILLLLVELGGLAVLSYGCWLAWSPAGFIVPGLILVSLSVIADLRRRGAAAAPGGKGEH